MSKSKKWQIIKLGDAATFINGYAFKPSDWKTEGLEIIRIQNLTKGSSSINYFDGVLNDRYKIVKGDFLISWSATLGIYEWTGGDAWLNQHLFKVVFNKKDFDKSFFKHLIAMSLKEMGQETHGSTMKHITKPRFDGFKIPLPPLAEQQKIAAILDAADSLRQKDQQLIDHYSALSQSLFIEMFGDPVTNPMGWNKKLFLDVFNIKTGKLDSNAASNDGMYPFFTCAKDELRINTYSYDEEVLLLAGNNAAGIFDVKYYKGKFDAYQRTYILTKKDDFFSYPFMQISLEKKLKDLQRLSIGSSTQYLTMHILSRLEFIVPPIGLQNQFAEMVRSISAQKQLAKSSLEKSEALFNSLLERAFKGDLTA